MDNTPFKILVLIGCMIVFWVYGAPPPSMSQLIDAATDKGPGKQERISKVGFGQPVDLHALAYPGKVTIIDFYSDYCPPCRAISPPLHDAVKANQSTALRVVDINRPGTQGIDWQSPVAQQNELRSIPFFVIFDATGNEVARGGRARDMVAAFLNKR